MSQYSRRSNKRNIPFSQNHADLEFSSTSKDADNPSALIYKRMENLLKSMQDKDAGICVRTIKTFMNKIPSVFTGSDVISWMTNNLDCDDTLDSLHLAHLLSIHGYIFPIDDHVLTVKNDNTYYRFQTPCLWSSSYIEPDDIDYAVYLCKRTMQNKQRLELADFEAENLACLQKTYAKKWEFIFLQAESQAKCVLPGSIAPYHVKFYLTKMISWYAYASILVENKHSTALIEGIALVNWMNKVDKKRDKLDRQILDSQERAYWDVHRPAPGCVDTTEVDIKKTCRTLKQSKTFHKPSYNVFGGSICPSLMPANGSGHEEEANFLQTEIEHLKRLLDRRRTRVSKAVESYGAYYETYRDYDWFLSASDPPNPWTSDNTELWEQETTLKDVPYRTVDRWSFSIEELLRDQTGREHFESFLEKEFSAENLKFWKACEMLKRVPLSKVQETVKKIYDEHLAPGAVDPVNVDSRVAEIVRQRMECSVDRYCLDVAEEHIFKLMKNDSYGRYSRSDMYKELLNRAKKKSKRRFVSEVRKFKELTNKNSNSTQIGVPPSEN